jgi:REP element-mobilizing transposase RayT
MPTDPIAFFISFTTYGAWLHGKDPGSVDLEHNQFGTPVLPPNSDHEDEMRAAMTQPPYLLDGPCRAVVLRTIVEVCRHRGWRLLACHVRTTHVHLVIQANTEPEKVMSDCKAYASRRLTEAGFEDRSRKRWTRHGSTRYIWDNQHLENAIHYVLHRQGAPMERYAEDRARLEEVSLDPSEPRA